MDVTCPSRVDFRLESSQSLSARCDNNMISLPTLSRSIRNHQLFANDCDMPP
jgi:hypothetical protein